LACNLFVKVELKSSILAMKRLMASRTTVAVTDMKTMARLLSTCTLKISSHDLVQKRPMTSRTTVTVTDMKTIAWLLSTSI
jgi:hypothetical protein